MTLDLLAVGYGLFSVVLWRERKVRGSYTRENKINQMCSISLAVEKGKHFKSSTREAGRTVECVP